MEMFGNLKQVKLGWGTATHQWDALRKSESLSAIVD